MPSLKGQWALVTGASSGLGQHFAWALAEQGADLVLVARRSDPMQTLAREIEARHAVRVRVQPADLSAPGAAAELKAALDDSGVQIDVLINNAGMGVIGDFLDQPAQNTRDLLNLNVLALTELTQQFATPMQGRGRGHILLVASIVAFQPYPSYAAYAASKAYVLSFGEALHIELARHGVVVSVLSPGITDTEFFSAAGSQPNAMMKRMMMAPRPVVDIGLAALFAGKSSVVAGALNRLVTFASRLFSRRWLARLTYRAGI
ncbi:SDR family oxidoreductase [Pseudomonas sp. HR96]|uniref:SDR family NAD(P)-dependent oxidoreductase n=1 Tax=Pseudomonas sp. HR96 TaxID=1027966 RepID=UPI002A74C714|nr:SDR family oxidoreductase [Pseudomonas sp. HR96]WPP00650.1 SDR family oxidoreductase [Pseudomonas sp. HR96]